MFFSWFDCHETLHLGFEIFKMAAVAMVTMKVKNMFLSDCNETSQECSVGCADVQKVFIEI